MKKRLPLTDELRKKVELVRDNSRTDFASNIMKQGWITAKQIEAIERAHVAIRFKSTAP